MEKEEQYNAAILQLESWLEIPGKPVEELEQISSAFRELQKYIRKVPSAGLEKRGIQQ